MMVENMINYLRVVTLAGVITLSLVLTTVATVVSTGDYNKDFYVTWSPTHVNTSGSVRTLMMDKESGSGFGSNDKLLFGQMDMQIKLIQGYSAGTVVKFYLQSDQQNRDEIDFEFLGNVTGQPYTLQTNVYANGIGNREQKTYLWFDPTKDFHTYSVFWNIYQIVWKVDGYPIRTFRNYSDKGVAFPMWQPMTLLASIWNGENWATRGGADKIDWSKAPFVASYKEYYIAACVPKGDVRACMHNDSTNWWNNPKFSTLTPHQVRQLKWARTHIVYDYCQDSVRFHGNLPKECRLPNY